MHTLRKATFRSGTPPPPPVIGDFYKQLFWYGFDPDDISSPADKTMFGGTKGKFNGLAFLLDQNLDPAINQQRNSNIRKKQRPQPSRSQPGYDDDENDVDDNYYYDNDNYDDDEEEEEENFNDTLDRLSDTPPLDGASGGGRRGRSSKTRLDYYDNDTLLSEAQHTMSNGKCYCVTPPYDPPRIFLEQNLKPEFRDDPSVAPPKRRKRRTRQSPWQQDTNEDYFETDRYENGDADGDKDKSASRDWAARKVSNWFQNEQDDGGFDEPEYKRPRRSKDGASSPWRASLKVIENFLAGDQQKRSYEATRYDRQMGINKSNLGDDKRNVKRREPRKGHTYRYDVDMREFDSIVEVDVVTDDNPPTGTPNEAEDDKQPEYGAGQPNLSPRASRKTQNKALSKDERALAWERVPPPNVPAWGPTGDLDMDALTRAYLDATDDIREAQYRLEQRKKQEQQAKDDITILKV
jgi:hypothetical protein